MAQKRDYYEVLGLQREATPDEVKRAYRKGALKYHPDNYRGDKAEGERIFKELAEAYEVLSDPVKRQRYDQYGHEGLRGVGVHDYQNMGFGDIFSMFEEIFGGGMGGGAGRGRGDRGLDLETEMEVSLEEVARGVDRTLEFERQDLCETCGGSGGKPGTSVRRCETCGGYGQVQQRMQSMLGISIRTMTCPQCQGKGSTVESPCEDCHGGGRRRKARTLSVHIPAGIRDGQVVRMRGEGEPSSNGTMRGDLHVYVRVLPHPLLVRRGDDLYCHVPISFTQAALGATVEVPALSGPRQVQIPAGTQSGDVLTLRGEGLPRLRDGRRGDLHVQVYIEVPKKLSQRQRELLEQYAMTENERITPQRKSFFDKVKEYFSATAGLLLAWFAGSGGSFKP